MIPSRCITERVHVFLRPRASRHSQSLRLPGRVWDETQAFRVNLHPSFLARTPIFHMRLLSLMDDKLINCWRERCGVKVGACSAWTLESAVQLQRELGQQLDDTLTGRSTLFDARPGGMPGETANLIITIAWLRK